MPKYVEQTVGERDSSLEARARQLPPELAEEYSDQQKSEFRVWALGP